jgi:hypothetical protein
MQKLTWPDGTYVEYNEGVKMQTVKQKTTFYLWNKYLDFCEGYYGAIVSGRIVIKYFYLYAMELHWFLFKRWIA